MQALYTLQKEIHANAVAKGFWETPSNNATQFMLMVSELSEAMEADRIGNPPDDKLPAHKSVTVELADTIIRILDYAEGSNIDVIGAMLDKVEMNKSRPRMHGNKLY